MKQTAMAGLARGITMVDHILKSPAPSIRADSRISFDIVTGKWSTIFETAHFGNQKINSLNEEIQSLKEKLKTIYEKEEEIYKLQCEIKEFKR